MSIWMLLVFAVCMLTAVLSFGAQADWGDVSMPLFLLTLIAFLAGILSRGIRRPVV